MNEKYKHIYKVFLKGSREGLDYAFRHTLRYLAEFERDYGEDSIPEQFNLKFENIEGFRVISFMTEGTGFTPDYGDLPGIDLCIWVLHNENAAIASTNDTEGIVINRKEVFGIPEDVYDIITPLDVKLDSETSEV